MLVTPWYLAGQFREMKVSYTTGEAQDVRFDPQHDLLFCTSGRAQTVLNSSQYDSSTCIVDIDEAHLLSLSMTGTHLAAADMMTADTGLAALSQELFGMRRR